MELIVISHPTELPGEHELVNHLFRQGLQRFHCRKPKYSKDEMEAYLRKIEPQFLSRTVIHSHYEMIGKYNLGGIHLTGNVLYREEDKKYAFEAIKMAQRRKFKISCSMHQVKEMEEVALSLEYAFVSPVFPSISKQGYNNVLSKEDIQEFLRLGKEKEIKVFALGGIEEGNIYETGVCGFDGVAVLGAIWEKWKQKQDKEQITELFHSMKLKCQKAGQLF